MGKKKSVAKEYFTGAFRHQHRACVREYIDDELAHELLKRSKKGDLEALAALRWIKQYNNEYYRGVLKKGDKTAINSSDKHYKEATDSHNARRRDLLSAARAGKLGLGTEVISIEENPEVVELDLISDRYIHTQEDTLIEIIAIKRRTGKE